MIPTSNIGVPQPFGGAMLSSGVGAFRPPIGVPTIQTGGFVPGATGIAPGFLRGPGIAGDIDPITPGIQTTPGVLTATGPSTIVPGGLGGIGGSTYRGVGVAGNAFIGGDADPITPGFQTGPGVVTATGPTTIMRSGFGAAQGGFVGASGFGGFGQATGVGFAGQPIIDADPITPGIQATPGVVTPVGPPVVVSGGAGMMASGFNATRNFGFGGDADPITPGFQTGPGVVTATGPSTIVSGGIGASGFNSGIAGGFIGSGFNAATSVGQFGDADPITPGIQATQGVVTATGPSTVVGVRGGNFGMTNSTYVQGGYNTAVTSQMATGSIVNTGLLASGFVRNGGVDLDPFTPGVQSTPGIVTQTGPSQVVGRVGNNCWDSCPWWIWPLLGLLLLGALIGTLYAIFRPKSSSSQQTDDSDQTDTSVRTECQNRFKNQKGECISCPEGSKWNGKSCSYQARQETKNTKKSTVDAVDGETDDGEGLATTTSVTNDGSSSSESKERKVPVFSKVQGEQGVNAAINSRTNEGFQPEVVKSQPKRMRPNQVQNYQGKTETSSASTDSVSTNIVKIPASVEKKSTPPVYSGASIDCNIRGTCDRGAYIGYGNTGVYSTSGEGDSSLSSSSSSSRSRKRVITKTRYEDVVVNPIVEDPTHKHMKRYL